jgi:riboflavin kinase/FMN adenylyltransferase
MAERVELPMPKREPRSRVITVGTFDGVHRGHQAVLNTLQHTSRAEGKPSLVVTFDPHPLYVIRPEHAPRLLATIDEKQHLLMKAGVDEVALVPFTRELADYSPREFLELVLYEHFGLDHLVIGYDHGLGKGRSGDVAVLQQIGHDLEVDVTVVPHADLHDSPVSSSRIRTALLAGNIVEANAALGYPYSITGIVVRGDGRGRELGFPTANLHVGDETKLLPLEGIYAVRVRHNDDVIDGVLHLGPRPTFPGANATVEVFLLDFNRDLYGEQLTLEFIERIRGVERFDTVEALVSAMHQDVARARTWL